MREEREQEEAERVRVSEGGGAVAPWGRGIGGEGAREKGLEMGGGHEESGLFSTAM